MSARPRCSENKGSVRGNITELRPLHPSDQWVPIGMGNYYKGGWNHRTMSGYGVYVTPNGKIIENSACKCTINYNVVFLTRDRIQHCTVSFSALKMSTENA